MGALLSGKVRDCYLHKQRVALSVSCPRASHGLIEVCLCMHLCVDNKHHVAGKDMCVGFFRSSALCV
jgi:hypothetical protein